jgi:hypothetical protein
MRRVVSLIVTVVVLAACSATRPAAVSSSTLGTATPSGVDRPTVSQVAAPPRGQPYCEKTPCVPPSLWRPLKIPHIGPRQPCLVSPSRKPNPRVYGAGRGIGPVYAAFGRGPLRVFLPPRQMTEFVGSDWGGAKLLWYAGPRVVGPLLIRGHQLDGRRKVRFERGIHPPSSLQLPTDRRVGWRDWPSYTRVRVPGCYGWQVDGPSFSELIIFQVVDTSP